MLIRSSLISGKTSTLTAETASRPLATMSAIVRLAATGLRANQAIQPLTPSPRGKRSAAPELVEHGSLPPADYDRTRQPSQPCRPLVETPSQPPRSPQGCPPDRTAATGSGFRACEHFPVSGHSGQSGPTLGQRQAVKRVSAGELPEHLCHSGAFTAGRKAREATHGSAPREWRCVRHEMQGGRIIHGDS